MIVMTADRPITPPPAPRAVRALSAPVAILSAGVFAGVLMGLGGCAAPSADATFTVPPERYPAAFDAARDAVRDFRFAPDRVDYVAGEISTRPRTSSGLATPWDADQSSLEQEWEDYTNYQSRRVRVRFEPASLAGSAGADAPGTQAAAGVARAPLAESGEPIVGRVEVSVSRLQRPGWRPQTRAGRQSTFTEDPGLTARGMFPAYEVMIAQDEKLAARIAQRIRRALEKQNALGVPSPSPATDPAQAPDAPSQPPVSPTTDPAPQQPPIDAG